MQRVETGSSFVRFELGDITVIALRDGYVDMPSSRLRYGGGQKFERLPPEVELVDGRLRLSVNAFLVIDNGQHILIDTGASDAWLPTMGFLPDALAEAGIPVDRIETVALTHTHSDHVSGLIEPGGKIAFPALQRVFVPKAEIAIFSKSSRLADLRPRCIAMEDGTPIGKRIRALQAAGHSPGHTAFEVESEAGKLLIWGDVVHVPSIQFSNPEITWEFDEDQAEALMTRRWIFALASRPDVYVAGAHLHFPGVGKVCPATSGYEFMPG